MTCSLVTYARVFETAQDYLQRVLADVDKPIYDGVVGTFRFLSFRITKATKELFILEHFEKLVYEEEQKARELYRLISTTEFEKELHVSDKLNKQGSVEWAITELFDEYRRAIRENNLDLVRYRFFFVWNGEKHYIDDPFEDNIYERWLARI